MRISARDVKRTDTGDAISDATVAWSLLNYADRTSVGSGTGVLRGGATNDYDAVIDAATLATLTVDAFYILSLVVTESGRKRTIERKVQAKRGY
jgi:hypothetical protein